MKHLPLDQANELHSFGRAAMSRHERLEHWVELLNGNPTRVLNTLEGTEYRTGEAQAAMRCDHSPISVAFDDAILRAEGLADDTYGEAKRFFELTDFELHNIVCYCHFGFTMYAGTVASRLRSMTSADRAIRGFDRPGHMSNPLG